MINNKNSESHIREYLEQEHGFIFHEPQYSNAPKPNTELVGNNNSEVNFLLSFLEEKIIIEDPYTTLPKKQRREVINSLGLEVCAFIDSKSKLRGNNMLIGSLFPCEVVFYLKRRNPPVQESLKQYLQNCEIIAEGSNYLGEHYRFETPFKQKVEIARKLDSEIYNFLEQISQ